MEKVRQQEQGDGGGGGGGISTLGIEKEKVMVKDFPCHCRESVVRLTRDELA